ncbi:membrane protein [Bombiscardovia apis]|uniref:Membrane protein n=1 Tax=Bombiscardovia apis TaxID=2932182 RepID=A0ABN6SE80_9BIFI|nr:vitamin K epoxide reductase family protein [Bombiscardovia apis]BDR54342.1 membrane protein [Bombiscardovia apis]
MSSPSFAANTGWRNSRTWTYLLALIASVAALVVSFVISAETLQMARNPESKLSCDINSTLSCTTVAQSWQSEIVHFGNMSFPNAFLGISVESVFVTIAVVGLMGVSVPRWFARASWLGSFAAFIYAYWLFSQSIFVIKALCPWCLVLTFSATIQFMAFSHASVSVQGLPLAEERFGALGRALRKYYRLHFDLMVDAVWIAAMVALVLVNYSSAIF